MFGTEWSCQKNDQELKPRRAYRIQRSGPEWPDSGSISGGISPSESSAREPRPKVSRSTVFPNWRVTPGDKAVAGFLHVSGNEPKHDQHQGSERTVWRKNFTVAMATGIKLLTTAYIGLAVPDRLRNNPQIYAEEVFATTDYNELFGSAVRTINDRGVGEGALAVLAKEFAEQLDGPRPTGWSDRYLIYRVYEYACLSRRKKEKRQVEKAFAEAPDGDLVAAHIEFGNGVSMHLKIAPNPQSHAPSSTRRTVHG